MYFIGIDLGTSAVKLLMMDETGNILQTISETYPINYPRPGWSEQNPRGLVGSSCARIVKTDSRN